MESVREFYDSMAADYHLIAAGWDDEVRSQGNLLQCLLTEKFNVSGGSKILDCSCGIGTQAIGLALQGYQVMGSDISEREIERATREAQRFGANVSFRVDDFLDAAKDESEKFDAVISFDNAIAHLSGPELLEQAFNSMKQRLRSRGQLLVSARDYDQLRQIKPTGTVPRLIEDEFGKRIYFQTWDWNEAGSGYSVNLFVLRPSGVSWSGTPFQTKMRAFTANEITDAMKRVGLKDIRRLEQNESKYYQPIYAASAK